jgi:hypothetical protein
MATKAGTLRSVGGRTTARRDDAVRPSGRVLLALSRALERARQRQALAELGALADTGRATGARI